MTVGECYASEMEGKDATVGGDIEARRVRFENERMTRRGALRKFGFMAGMAVFATLSVDDLARIAAKKMQEQEATKGIGDTLAKEFRAAGVVLANDDPGNPNPYLSDCSGCTGYCIPDADYDCVDCPSTCATPMWPWGGKKKRLKCADAQGFWNACAGNGNQVDCCQQKCFDCCATKPCGMRPDAVVHACQSECARLNKSIV